MGGSISVPYVGSPRPTLGVEWELALVDQTSGDLTNRAAELFERITAIHGSPPPSVHQELLRNTVELVTGICTTTSEAMADLRASVDLVRAAADPMGVNLFGAGTHPFAQWSAQQISESPRYAELIDRTQWWGRQMLIWGVHVHVGVDRREKVLPIITGLLRYYPHLLALSASSPMWAGHDTGYASNRAMMFQQLPTAGLPFHFQQWEEFEGFVYDQKTTGIIEHLNEIRWDIRPATHLGTIEVRICDGVSNFVELESLVALIHCLIVHLDHKLEVGEPLDHMPPWHVQENKWRAARYGLDAIIIQDSDSRERLVTDDLADLVEELAPVAGQLDCTRELLGVLDIPRRGGSYQRQRRAADGRETPAALRAVVASVVAELER